MTAKWLKFKTLFAAMLEKYGAYGLLNLRQVDAVIAARKRVAGKYVSALKNVKGIELFPYEVNPTFEWNYAYFPILVTEDYRMTRDALYEFMKAQNVLGRRYFYPLITYFEPYKAYPSADEANLPVANRLASQVICLPMHNTLTDEDMNRVLNVILK